MNAPPSVTPAGNAPKGNVFMGYSAPAGNQPIRKSRAYLEFTAAVVYYFFARLIANHAANGLAGEAWMPFVEQCILLFLLVVVYASFGRALDRQAHPLSEQGLPPPPR